MLLCLVLPVPTYCKAFHHVEQQTCIAQLGTGDKVGKFQVFSTVEDILFIEDAMQVNNFFCIVDIFLNTSDVRFNLFKTCLHLVPVKKISSFSCYVHI